MNATALRSSAEEVIQELEWLINDYCDDEILKDTLSDTDIYTQYKENRLKELRLLLYAYEKSLEQEEEDLQFDMKEVVENTLDRYERVIEYVSYLEFLTPRFIFSLVVSDCNDDTETQRDEQFCSCVNAASGTYVPEAAVFDGVVGSFDTCPVGVRFI